VHLSSGRWMFGGHRVTTHEIARERGERINAHRLRTQWITQHSESTDNVAEHSGSITKSPGFPRFWIRFDGITYDTPFEGEVAGRPLSDEDLGPKFAEVNGEAASNLVPVYAVKGYDTSFRLAARINDRSIMFEALLNPKANDATDVLDIGGKVSSISVTDQYDADRVLHTIEDPEEVEQLVQGLMEAPLKTTIANYYRGNEKNHFLIVFHLKDGTAVARHYRKDTGRLTNLLSGGPDQTPASGIVTPQAFRGAVEEAVKGYLEYLEKLYPTKAEEQRQKRTCGDTRTTNEARRIDRGFEFYTTNDVPGGPWGGVLSGTEEDDNLAGEDGEDEAYALGGDDDVEGGACDDKVYGEPGDDAILGGTGSDVIYGGPGRDHVRGEEGDDVIYGGPGDDKHLEGYLGEDILYGWYGNDLLYAADRQQDELYCGEGRDEYIVDEIDYVSSSCEVEVKLQVGVSGDDTIR
jgi:hypothetical protein